MDIDINLCTGVNIDKDLREWLDLASKKYGDTFRTKLFGSVSSLWDCASAMIDETDNSSFWVKDHHCGWQGARS